MRIFSIRRKYDKSTIHEGIYGSFLECVEAALGSGKSLDGADFRNSVLCNISLDGAIIRGADFTGANLTGANLSEADLRGCGFAESSLYNACLCWSDFNGCDFRYAGFGATDISGSRMDCGTFAGLSAFSLNFRECLSMKCCTYEDASDRPLPMSSPPLVVTGLERTLAMLDRDVVVGNFGVPMNREQVTARGEDASFLGKYAGLTAILSEIASTRHEQLKVVDKPR